MKLKDRVVLLKEDKYIKDTKGTVVRLQYRSGEVKNAVVLWDKDWPTDDSRQPRLYYYKTGELKVVDTWDVE